MRRLICAMLAATLLLTACSADTPLEESQGALEEYIQEYTIEESESPPEQLDFYQELRERGSLITAAFDFEEFSVWFAVTPGFIHMGLVDAYVWHILHPSRPNIAAIVRNVDGRYILVEEIEVDIHFQPVGHDWWWFDAIPDSIPQVGNQHLVQRDGYRVSDLQADLFFAGPAITVHTDEQMILVHYIFRGVRQLIFTRDGITANHTLETLSNQPRILLSELESLEFSPETGVLTLVNDVYTLRVDADGITETVPQAEFELLIPGELAHVDELLGLSALDSAIRHALSHESSTITDVRNPIIRGRMYRFPLLSPSTAQTSELRLDSFDLTTLTPVYDQLIHDFSPEIVLRYFYSGRGITVYTDAAAYLLSNDFEILHRADWPPYFLPDDSSHRFRRLHQLTIDDGFTRMAFVGEINGIYGTHLLELTEGASPTLLQPRIIPEDEERIWEFFEYPSPVQFFEGERLLIGVGVQMAGTGLFRLIDFSGNIIEEFPFGATGAYAGGFAFLNQSMVIFEPQLHEAGRHFFDFESGILSPTDDWWESDELVPHIFYDYENGVRTARESWWRSGRIGYTAYIPSPNNPRVWYVSSVHHRTGQHGIGSEERSYILRLDFEAKTVTPVITITEMNITLMAVGEYCELVFAYSGQSDSGFAVFTPARQVP